MASCKFADISEWQPSIDAPAYMAGGYKIIIARAHSGYKPDGCFPARRDYLRKYDFAAVGYYQYMVASRDAEQQARDFIATVGPLKPNEFVVCDSEEGSGSQQARVTA